MTKNFGTKRDRVFMEMAYSIARLSKDESTHIGAIIVGPDHEIRSTGYNSFPRGIKDHVVERQSRPIKYLYFAHAEANAVFNAARIGVPLKGCRVYTNGTPCDKCAQALIGAGITEVIIDSDWEEKFLKIGGDQWQESVNATKIMFDEADIQLWAIDDFKTPIPRFLRGEFISF